MIHKQFLFGTFIILSILILIYFINYSQVNITLLNFLLVKRGLIAPNCKWFTISEKLLQSDTAGIDLYKYHKKNFGDFSETYMFGKKIYVVTNIKYIKIILDNSPNLFSVGNLKLNFFKHFMKKNVGVSKGCPWKHRRFLNEKVLFTNYLHTYSNLYNNYISNNILKWKCSKEIYYEDFLELGKTLTLSIVFNSSTINHSIFDIFSELNTIDVFYKKDFKINPKLYNYYKDTLYYYINHPKENSIVKLCLNITNNKEEIFNQIPHFMFPIVGIFGNVIPRLLLLLCNHKDEFKKVLNEIYNITNNNIYNYDTISKLDYLRKCILETLRLNNSVFTTFRTLEKNYTFDDKYSFKKGDQFLILNYPILRETEFFNFPNQFMPSRWNNEMENSYYNLTFNQGPQKCPGKDLCIYLIQSFIFNFIRLKQIGIKQSIHSSKINRKNIPQVLNPCNIKFYFKSIQK